MTDKAYRIAGYILAGIIVLIGSIGAFSLHAYADSLNSQRDDLAQHIVMNEEIAKEIDGYKTRLKKDDQSVLTQCQRDRSQTILWTLLNHMPRGVQIVDGGTAAAGKIPQPVNLTHEAPAPGATPSPTPSGTPNPYAYIDEAAIQLPLSSHLSDLVNGVNDIYAGKWSGFSYNGKSTPVINGSITKLDRSNDLVTTTITFTIEQPTHELCELVATDLRSFAPGRPGPQNQQHRIIIAPPPTSDLHQGLSPETTAPTASYAPAPIRPQAPLPHLPGRPATPHQHSAVRQPNPRKQPT